MTHHDDIRRRQRQAAEELFKPKPAPPPAKAPVLTGTMLYGTPFPYIFHWRREGRKDQACRVLVRGKMNSVLVEFQDGFQMVTSRNAIRRKKKAVENA